MRSGDGYPYKEQKGGRGIGCESPRPLSDKVLPAHQRLRAKIGH